MTRVDVSKNCLSAHTHETTHGKSTIVLELLKWNKEDQNKKQITKKELHSLPLSEGLKPYNALQCPAAWAGWDPKAEIWWDSGRKRCASIWAPFRSVFLAPLCNRNTNFLMQTDQPAPNPIWMHPNTDGAPGQKEFGKPSCSPLLQVMGILNAASLFQGPHLGQITPSTELPHRPSASFSLGGLRRKL